MGNMKWILGSDWLPEQARRAHLAHLQLSTLIPHKEKKIVEQTYKVHNFWTMSEMEQKGLKMGKTNEA